MARATWIQHPKTGKLIEAAEYYRLKAAETARVRAERYGGISIVPDWGPHMACRSMADGEWLTNRAQHEENCRRNGVICVGNDPEIFRPPKPEKEDLGPLREIVRAAWRGEIKPRPEHHLPTLPLPPVDG